VTRTQSTQLRYFAITQAFLCDRTAGVKGATRRRGERARYVTLQKNPLLPARWVGLRRCAEERLSIGMTRALIDLPRRGKLDYAPEYITATRWLTYSTT